MKTIYKIAKTELALLFYSPIAWFLLIAFMFQCGLAYTGALEGFLTAQEMGGRSLSWLNFLTAKVFAPPFGIWPGLAAKLYLYLPLLTMGLMSREISSGTIKLLYSSPIKVREIVLGKFAAMMLYNLILVVVLLVLVLCGLFQIHSADAGLLFSGLLGIYLLLCTYAAIGLFMSCLTGYQVVAALSTLVLLAVLSYIGSLWQDMEFVRDLTYFLSISGRAGHMLMGLITTKDIVYFLVIIAVFISFSIYKLRSDSESIPVWVRVSRYAAIVAATLAVGYVLSRPQFTGYADVTATHTNTLAVSGQQILRETGDEPLEVTSYINLLDGRFFYGRPDQRNTDMSRWEPYLRFKPDIKFNYVYYYDSVPDKNLYKYNQTPSLQALAAKYFKSMKLDSSLFKTPQEIRRMIDLRPEQNRYVMQLKYKGRTTFLRLYDDQMVFPTETETGAAIKRLMQAKMPKIGFVKGDLERSIDKAGDRGYKLLTNEPVFRYSLVNQGFDVQTVTLQDAEIPSDLAALVVADPKVAMDTVALGRLRRWIDQGGNLLLAGEPGKQALLNPILEMLHVRMMEGELMERSKDFSPELIMPYLTKAGAGLARSLRQSREDSMVATLRGAAALSYDSNGPFHIEPLLVTDPATTWNKLERPDAEAIESAEENDEPVAGKRVNMAVRGSAGMTGNAGMRGSAGTGSVGMRGSTGKGNAGMQGFGGRGEPMDAALQDLSFDSAKGDRRDVFPTIVSLTRMVRGREQRIVVSGDADLLSNAELGRRNPRTCNFALSTGIFSWLSYGTFPIDSFRPKGPDNSLDLTSRGFATLKIFLLGILPGLVLIGGAVLLIRRKRK